MSEHRVLIRGLATRRDLAEACAELGIATGERFIIARELLQDGTPQELDAAMLGGHQGDETSKAAAERNFPRSGTQRYRVFVAVLEAMPTGTTSDEIARKLGIPLYSAKPRLTELRKYGAVAKAGTRSVSGTGAESDVYVVTLLGYGEARERGMLRAAA
jgi:hypothetical protein